MASYGYGGGYTAAPTTTSYGAQGGADGGGFVGGGSQAGSQDTPGGSKVLGKDALRPVTIKQIIDATRPHPDAEFRIDGSEASQLTFTGQIQTILPQATNTTFKVDDGTGIIEVKQWVDSDADASVAKPLPREGEYVRVQGRLKEFNNKRHIGAHIIRTIEDFNEISYHLLEATAVHLYFTRGPPEMLNGGGMKAEGNNTGGMFVDSGNGAAGHSDAAAVIQQKLPRLSAGAKKVFSLLQSAPQNNEGLHISNIAAQLKVSATEVWKGSDELLGEGLIYTTVDDETWAVLEY